MANSVRRVTIQEIMKLWEDWGFFNRRWYRGVQGDGDLELSDRVVCILWLLPSLGALLALNLLARFLVKVVSMAVRKDCKPGLEPGLVV